jgi:hypothetical protein
MAHPTILHSYSKRRIRQYSVDSKRAHPPYNILFPKDHTSEDNILILKEHTPEDNILFKKRHIPEENIIIPKNHTP